MTGKTHIIGGVAAATIATQTLNVYKPNSITEFASWSVLFVTPAIIGALAPDIDHGNSKASNVNIFTKILSIFLRIVCGHRGVIHSPIFMAVLSVALYFILSAMGFASAMEITIGFTLGYFSHLVIDMLNEAGIPILFPFVWKEGKPKKYHILSLSEGGLVEFLIWLILFVTAAGFGYAIWVGM